LFKKYEETNETCYALSDRKITTVKNLPNKGIFPKHIVELDLMDNFIINPKDITEFLVDLPNLKALWMNNCPVVEACANFEAIADLMPVCEIINSQLTSKAGEWAFLTIAKESGAKTLEEITTLDLSGRKVMHMKSAEVFGKLKNLKKLDITDHEELFMCEEKKEQVEFN
jgi:hypothetical protein